LAGSFCVMLAFPASAEEKPKPPPPPPPNKLGNTKVQDLMSTYSGRKASPTVTAPKYNTKGQQRPMNKLRESRRFCFA
jgi:hypothetical protein